MHVRSNGGSDGPCACVDDLPLFAPCSTRCYPFSRHGYRNWDDRDCHSHQKVFHEPRIAERDTAWSVTLQVMGRACWRREGPVAVRHAELGAPPCLGSSPRCGGSRQLALERRKGGGRGDVHWAGSSTSGALQPLGMRGGARAPACSDPGSG